MVKVRKRGGFSDRNGLKKENDTIQLDSLDDRTRNQLVTLVSLIYKSIFGNYRNQDECQRFCRFVISEVYSEVADYRKIYDPQSVFEVIKDTILDDDYDSVLTLIEALAQFWNNNFSGLFNSYYHGTVFDVFHNLFEKEYVGYRFVDDKITKISDENEITAINEAITCPFDEVREHIKKANSLLSDRKKPDYENSIKESICAVEAICEIILNVKGKKAILSDMLKSLERNGIQIHPSLKEAFIKLYGYTNDSNGIRHAGNIGGPASTFEEAKFMLVSCCAFINYLIAIQAKTKQKFIDSVHRS